MEDNNCSRTTKGKLRKDFSLYDKKPSQVYEFVRNKVERS